MRFVCLLTGLIIFTSPVKAFFDTGNELLQLCTESAGQGICLGTIIGYFDAAEALGYKCPGNPTRLTKGQIRDVVLKALRENPADRHLPASYVALFAFQTAMGCAQPKPGAK